MKRLFFILFLVLGLSACAQPYVYEEERFPAGGAVYKVTKQTDGTIEVDIRVGNDSDNVKGEVLVDPVTRKITGFKFEKTGTKGAEVAAMIQRYRLELALQQSGMQTETIQQILNILSPVGGFGLPTQ